MNQVRKAVIPVAGRLESIHAIVLKPLPGEAPSMLGVPGRDLLNSGIFYRFDQQERGASGEMQLTDAIAVMTKQDPVPACRYGGRLFDYGSEFGYFQATNAMSLKHAETGTAFHDFLRTYR